VCVVGGDKEKHSYSMAQFKTLASINVGNVFLDFLFHPEITIVPPRYLESEHFSYFKGRVLIFYTQIECQQHRG
jgi:hypothetical protein